MQRALIMGWQAHPFVHWTLAQFHELRDTLSERKFTLEGESRTLLSFVRVKRAATRVSHAPSKNTKTAPGVNCMVKNRAISPL
jgi:hypothetical protein